MKNKHQLLQEIAIKLQEIKIDHTDSSEDGYNQLCSQEVKIILNIVESAFKEIEIDTIERVEKAIDEEYKSFSWDDGDGNHARQAIEKLKGQNDKE